MNHHATDSQVRIEPATIDDVPELTPLMTRAFDDGSRRFRGIEKGGPPGYDNGEFLRKWMPMGTAFKVSVNNRIAGSFILFLENPDDGANWVGNIFIDPEYQSLGIGQEVMAYIHETYPAEIWRLETPEWSTRNHHFYERCGYRKVNEYLDEDEGIISFVFERTTISAAESSS